MEVNIAKKNNMAKEVSYFLKNSSVHAVSQIAHSSSRFRKIFWVVVLIICIVGCIYEMCRWLNVYFQYPVLINMEIQNPLKADFPAVTICNLNRVKWEHEDCAKQGMSWIECEWAAESGRTLIFSETQKAIVPQASESEILKKIQEESTLFLQGYSNLDIYTRKQYGYSYDELFRRCSFNSDVCGVHNFTLFQDLQFGNCFTFNKRDRSEQQPLISNRAGPHYGLELELDPLEEETYLDITPIVGFLVVIHKADEDPNPAEDGINISPGFETHLSITKTSIKRLPAPYRDRCFNYSSSATDLTIKSEYDCVRMCIQEVSTLTCDCVDPLLPTLEHMERCDVKNKTDMSCLKDVLERMIEDGLPCECPLPCETTSYTIQTSASSWHFSEDKFSRQVDLNNINSSACNNESDSLYSVCDDLQSNEWTKTDNAEDLHRKQEKRALLKIFFKNFEHTVYSQEPTFTEAELYAHLGGHLSFWLGLSLMAIFECIQAITDILKFLLLK